MSRLRDPSRNGKSKSCSFLLFYFLFFLIFLTLGDFPRAQRLGDQIRVLSIAWARKALMN